MLWLAQDSERLRYGLLVAGLLMGKVQGSFRQVGSCRGQPPRPCIAVVLEMRPYKNLYPDIYSFGNLYTAYRKARKGKRSRPAVAVFELN